MSYFRNKPKKYYLHESFKGNIPKTIINSKKTGFSIPVYSWLSSKIKVKYPFKKNIIQDYKVYSMFIGKEIYKR